MGYRIDPKSSGVPTSPRDLFPNAAPFPPLPQLKFHQIRGSIHQVNSLVGGAVPQYCPRLCLSANGATTGMPHEKIFSSTAVEMLQTIL